MGNEYREFKKIVASRESVNVSSLEEVIDKIKNYDFLLIFYIDRVELKLGKDFVVEDSIVEIRAFDKDEELHLLKNGLCYVGRIVRDNDDGVDYYEVVDDLYKIWGQVNFGVTNVLSEDRGIQIKLPFNIDKDKLLFAKVRNYFTAEGELKNIDWRLMGYERKNKDKLEELK